MGRLLKRIEWLERLQRNDRLGDANLRGIASVRLVHRMRGSTRVVLAFDLSWLRWSRGCRHLRRYSDSEDVRRMRRRWVVRVCGVYGDDGVQDFEIVVPAGLCP